MALIFEDIFVPGRTKTRQKAIVCDLCKTSSPRSDSWGKRHESVQDVTVEYRAGKQWGNDANIDVLTFDLCPKCFTEKLVPWLCDQGAKPRKSDGGW